MKKCLFATVVAVAAIATFAAPRKVLLVVQNHCTGNVRPPMSALADTLAAELSGDAFNVVNPHNVIGVAQNRTPTGEAMPEVSAKEMARMLGAEGIVTASVLEFTGEAIGVPAVAYAMKARLSMNLADTATGKTVVGVNNVKFSKNYTVEQVAEDNATLFESLLHSAAGECAAKFISKASMVEWTPEASKMISVFFGCNVLGADIQIDGLSRGTAPAQLQVSPGVHKLLVKYPPYYYEFKRDALFESEGQTYAVALQITPEGEEQRMRSVEYEKKLLELKKTTRMDDLDYEKKKKSLEAEQAERSELFKKQLALADAMLERYTLSGEADDYVRRTIADGTATYWKNSFGRVAITEGSVDNIELATPTTDAGDLSVPPNPTEIGEGLQKLLMKRIGR